MTKKKAAQFIDVATRIYDYAIKLERQNVASSDLIAIAMLQTVAFYAIKRLGPSSAAEWISEQINIALKIPVK